MVIADYLVSCEKMIRQGSSTFHKAFGYLPSPRKEAVYVIYAFCRLIDDSVDELDRSPYTIDELEERFAALETASGHFIWPALRWLFEQFPVAKEPFFRQMEGQRKDLVLTHYDTMEQLEQYCYLVAGTVGEMLLPVLHDAPDRSISEAGISLGKAMQIVNIVRDIGEDRGRNRRYVPLQWMKMSGYTLDEFERGEVNDAFRALIERLEQLAREWFEQGLRGIETYPLSSGFSVELASRYYEAILDEVKAMDYDVYRKRAYVGSLAKLRMYHVMKRKYGELASSDPGGTASAL
ncbi:phytoene/squalene synthase family protein [Paenibacillus sp. strain BS8-2]